MSVDFSQFFNGPIRDSLIAQVSDYLDITRPQATTAYDQAVALTIGAMATQAREPDGAQALLGHIQKESIHTNLTSSALSPTVLTNDQFAQIITLGESEQADVLGKQHAPVISHLETVTGLDSKAVGSLLAIVIPFVLSFLKNNLAHEAAPAQALPVLLASQANHVAPLLDAPALAALGADTPEALYGEQALAAAGVTIGADTAEKHPATGTTATTARSGNWFKWVLALAVLLALIAWMKSCSNSATEPADETAAPAANAPASGDAAVSESGTTPPAAAPAPSAAGTPATGDAAGPTTESPATSFPEPVADKDSAAPKAGATENTQDKPAGNAESGANNNATQVGAGTGAATETAPSSAAASDKPAPDADNAATKGETGAAAADTAPPTTGMADDKMEEPAADASSAAPADTPPAPEAQPAATGGQPAASTDQGGAGSAATSPDTASADSTGPAAGETSAGDNAGGQNGRASVPAPMNEATEKPQAAATTPPAEKAETTAPAAIPPGASTDVATTQPKGKTTTFADTPAPVAAGSAGTSAEDASEATPAAPPRAETQSDAAPGKTTTFANDTPAATATETTTSESAAASEPAAPTQTAVGQLQLRRDGDTLHIAGTVPDAATRSRVISAAKLIDGHSRIEDELAVNADAPAAAFDDYNGLMGLLRDYHGVSVVLDSDKAVLSGAVASTDAAQALARKAGALLGEGVTVSNQTQVEAAPATQAAAKPVSETTRVVLFATGSAEIDSRFQAELEQYADHLKQSGKAVSLSGYTDASGSEQGNLALSRKRAESVKAYLVLQGVDADKITIQGEGMQSPVADNATEAGRAQNRRVRMSEQP